MRAARLVVVYVFVICPECGARVTHNVGRDITRTINAAIWHASRLQEPRVVACPGCRIDLQIIGEQAFTMPWDDLEIPDEEPPSPEE